MVIVGLTGSMGMGKSTAAERFRARGCPVFDADAEVHRLYAGEAAPLIEAAFPGSVVDGRVDRARLAQAVLGDAAALSRLEAIIHPLVRERERAFVLSEHEAGTAIVVLEIPLLFETGGDARVDATVVVSAPAAIQRERVLARPGMSPEKLEGLIGQQMPDAEKRARADYVVDTGGPVEQSRRRIDMIVDDLRRSKGRAVAHWQGKG